MTTLTVPGNLPNRAEAYRLAQEKPALAEADVSEPAPPPPVPEPQAARVEPVTPPAPPADAAFPPAVPALRNKTRAEIDAELGLPPAETGLAAPPPVAGTWDVLGAAWRAETIKTDAWNETVSRKVALLDQMIPLLDAEARGRIFATRGNPGADRLAEKVIAEANRMAAASVEDAQRWASFPKSKEEFDRTIDEGRRADLDEAQALLDQPGGAVAEFFGTTARAITDETSVMLMPFGIQGSAFKTIVGEALLGAVGEAAVLPKEYRVADELGLPDPDPVSRIALGAVAGGGFSAALIGLGKGVRALAAKAEARRASLNETIPPGLDRIDHEAGVEAAEAKLRGDQTVQERLGDVAGGARTEPPEGTLGDILDDPKPATLPPASAGGLVDADEWGPIRNGIFAGESGGDYNALYGYQNRKGGKFANVRLTEMTVNQAIAFSAPSGPYGQWVKNTIGRVATPMGAYQIVGTTLRAAKKGLGLKGDEVMTPELQEMLGQWIYRQQGTGAWQGYKGPRDSYTPGSVDGPAPDFGPTVRGYTGQGQVAVGDATRIDVDYEVVDYRSLIRASGDLQPRDRTRINSDEWVAATAARLDPAQLMPAPTADRGTPIVGPDNVIESGNGRTMAIARAYERHPDRAQAYRGAIEAAGFTIPEGVEQPVLIARRRTDLTPDQRRQMVIDAQDSGVAQMTPTEVARATSRNLQASILSRLDPAQPLTADANGDFVRAALATLPRSARNAMFDPGGALNALGQRQLKEAIFARAWPDPDILARYTEGAPAELKSLMEALETAAPGWAALKADIEAGLVTPDMDISGFVLDAMRLIGAARELGTKGTPMATAIAELLDEVDMLKGAISPLTAALVRKMWRNGRAAPADEVARFLTRYADEARKAGQAGGMFDTPAPRDVLRTIDPETFKDLPEDLGQVRGFATRPTSEAPPETVAELPDQGFDQGAQSPEAEAVHAEIEAGLRPAEAGELEDLLTRSASLDEIATHPRVVAAVAEMDARIPTSELPGYGTDEFWANRVYRAGDAEITGRAAAVKHLYDQARGLAWSDEGLPVPAAPVKAERRATILLGPPAAGKSTIANPLARARSAMIVDADEAKKLIPEYDRGIGAAAVHEESSALADRVLAQAVQGGQNVVLPKVGANPASIERLATLLAQSGYRVDLVLVDVPEAVAAQRMIRRFMATGRIIPLDILQKGVDGAKATYQLLKSKEQIHAYSHIDNSPDLGQARRAVEDRAEVLAEIARGDRGDGDPVARGSVPRSGPEGLTDPAAGRSEAALPPGEAAAAISAARDDLGEFADIEITLPDGTTARAGDILDDIDADRQADAVTQACATSSNGAPT